jgi:predicted permease
MLQDTRYALRRLRAAPTLSAAIILTLALGIGANSAVFSLADRLFVRPPSGITRPTELRRIYALSTWSPGSVLELHSEIGYPQYGAVASASGSRAAFTAYTRPDSVVVGGQEARTVAQGSYVDTAYFPVLGAKIERGRAFSSEDQSFGNPTFVAVISHDYWLYHFNGAQDIIGRREMFDRRRFTIIGVAASGFHGPDLHAADIWLPLPARVELFPNNPWYRSWRSNGQVRAIARLAPATSDRALASLATAAFRAGERANVPRGADTATIVTGPILESLGPSVKPRTEAAIVTRLIGVAIMLLVVACANVANLLLARAVSRRREIAVRLALGVSRVRLASQLFAESLTLGALAAVIATIVGLWTGAVLARLILPATHLAPNTIDWRTVGATFTFAIATAGMAGVAPVFYARRTDVASALKSSTNDPVGKAPALRAALVVAQTALSMVLIVGAGLFARSLHDLRSVDLGYDADRLVYGTAFFVIPETRAVDRYHVTAQTADGMREVLRRIERSTDVEAVAQAVLPPMHEGMSMPLFTDVGPVPYIANRGAAVLAVSSNYFRTTGMELRRGRLFGVSDDISAPSVAVVNEAAAKAYWPRADAMGQCLHLQTTDAPCTRVIGVSKDSHLRYIIEERNAEVFVPVAQQRGLLARPGYVVARAAPGQAARVAETVRVALRSVFPSAEPPEVKTLASDLEAELRPWRLGTALFSAFGLLALAVAGVGVYSAMAYSVTERTREIGIRSALGATDLGLVGLVVARTMKTVGIGIAVGVAIALASARALSSMLYGTSSHDPVVLAAACAALGLLALVASAAPAWRAARVDPMVAIRVE